MGTQVITHSKCDRCNATKDAQGAHGDVPPENWARLDLHVKRDGSGWTKQYRHEWILCNDCWVAVEGFLDADH